MNTWFIKILLISGEVIYVAVRNSTIKNSSDIAKEYFTGEGEPFNAFSPVNPDERTQVFVSLRKIQAFWISDRPFA